MNILIVLLLLPLVIVAFVVIPRRLRMERRAKELLADMPQHEIKTVYLPFRSKWFRGKEVEMDSKIAAEVKDGWTFLKAGEANPFMTIRSWGGGINLHFIASLKINLQLFDFPNGRGYLWRT